MQPVECACTSQPLGEMQALTILTPAYLGHLHPWTTFMTSMLIEPPRYRGKCAFAHVQYHTVLSSRDELAPFRSAFNGARVVRRCSKHLTAPQLTTLEEVLTIVSWLHGSVRGAKDFNISSTNKSRNKCWYQNVKKLYGCLALASGWCFVTDAEGFLVRNSPCNTVTQYARHRTVFISRANETFSMLRDVAVSSSKLLGSGQQRTWSSKLLGLGQQRKRVAGPLPLFGAMHAYSWMWPAYILREFALGAEGFSGGAVETARFGVPRPFGHAFIEDAIYKFLSTRRTGPAGFVFVDAPTELNRLR